MERLDLAGMDFIWRIAMETPDEEIANEAILLIITYSYTNLNPKMKKVSTCVCAQSLHVCLRITVELKMLPLQFQCIFQCIGVFCLFLKLVNHIILTFLPYRILCLCTRSSLLIVTSGWR